MITIHTIGAEVYMTNLKSHEFVKRWNNAHHDNHGLMEIETHDGLLVYIPVSSISSAQSPS